MTSTLKHKGKHRKSLPALDKAIEESYPVGYEVVDQVHKESRKDLKGQFIYAALLDIDRKQYIATIKLDDTAVDTRGHFKDIKIKERPLYAGQLQAVVDLPADRNVTVQQLIDYVKADFSESSLFSEEMPTVPDYNGLRFSIADYSLDEQSDIIDILTSVYRYGRG